MGTTVGPASRASTCFCRRSLYHGAMKSLPAIVLAALLIVSPAMGAVTAPEVGHGPATADDAALDGSERYPNAMTIDGSERSNATFAAANASATLTLRSERLEGRFERDRTAERIDGLNDTQEKRRFVRFAVTRINVRTDELRTAERRAFRRHSDGEITTRELLVRLARIDAEARQLSANLTMIDRRADEIEGFNDIQSRIGVIRIGLLSLQGPVRERVGDVVRGNADSTRVYAETSGTGVVLATVEDGSYVREAYDADRRATDAGSKISVGELPRTLRQNYPIWMDRSGENYNTVYGQQASDTFIVRMSYDNARLTTFVDRGNERAYKEHQRIRLNETSPVETANSTQAGLQLAVHSAYPGGPMLVRLTDADDGDPVAANVTFTDGDGRTHLVGRTDADGERWTVTPNETVTARAIRGNDVVSVRVSPTDPVPLGAEPNGTTDGNETDAESVAVRAADG